MLLQSSVDPSTFSVDSMVSLSGVGSGLSGKEFTGTAKSTGSITVKDRTITIKNLMLFNADGEKRTVDAVLPF